jgi:FtsP/CotA-like multicopper oxidase with cupredoxin domain
MRRNERLPPRNVPCTLSQMRRSLSVLTVGLLTAWSPTWAYRPPVVPSIVLNDNIAIAGTTSRSERTVALEIRRGLWSPFGRNHPGTPMLAFAERGKTASIPGPMIRVPLGTRLRVSVRNTLDTTMVVWGFWARTLGTRDSLVIPPHGRREVRFVVDAIGNYFYYGARYGTTFDSRYYDDSQLNGALIVDPPNGRTVRDRVLVIAMTYQGRGAKGRPSITHQLASFNGRPWPFTERFTYNLGDTIRFRIINASNDVHPIHLHGAFFRIDARGDLAKDSAYTSLQRRMAATEFMDVGTTMSMTWFPERPGTWLMHCHLTPHTIRDNRFGAEAEDSATFVPHAINGSAHRDPANHVVEGMGGLVVAVTVRPPKGWRPTADGGRLLRLVIPSDSGPGDAVQRFAPTLFDGDAQTGPVARTGPGAPIVLHQGEPTRILVVNHSPEATAIHWHGMELENYYDGVVGVGGSPGALSPAVMPGDSFEVRMTPPRAGTFIYHSHMLELRQTVGGLYGALIVLPQGATWDAEHDHVYVIGSPKILTVTLNGMRDLAGLEVPVGATQRLRFINITVANPGLRVRIVRDDSTRAEWTTIAKDGMDLPPYQRLTGPAEHAISIGETYDFAFTPSQAGTYALQVRTAGGDLVSQQPITVTVRR